MPKIETIEKFISMVESNKHVEAIEDFYTSNASMQENQTEPRVGRDNLIANENKVLSRTKNMTSKCIRPFFVNDNYVTIQWQFRFEFKDDTFIEIEEMVKQEWIDERIDKERFFYDPKQFIPKPIKK